MADTDVRTTITVDAPPALEADEGAGGVLAGAVPMLGSLGSMALVATLVTPAGTSGHRSLLAAGGFLLGTLAFVLVQLDRQRARRRRRRDAARHGYLGHLADVRRALREAAGGQRDRLLREHPPPVALLTSTSATPSGLVVRLGVGDRSPDRRAEPVPSAPGDDPDPAALDARRRLLAAYAALPDLPLTLDLASTRRVSVQGEPEAARSLVRAIVVAAAAAHPPGRLSVEAVTDVDAEPEWAWLRWLPHALVEPTLGAHRVVVVDGGPAPSPGGDATVLRLRAPASGPGDDDVVVRLAHDGSLTADGGGPPLTGRADACDAATAEVVARRLLARWPPSAPDPSVPDVRALLGLGREEPRAGLSTAVGVTEDGAPLHLDLAEAAQGGDGPHGLVVGATGSGKSELLRTLVLGLAVAHPPDRLNLVLVDFKGGATFAGLASLPHVAAAVTNLADDLTLVDRMEDALAGELLRRQELLSSLGLGSVREHALAREQGGDLAPLPSLLVVVDEFAELLAARPQFLEVFTTLGRLGRSLGVHLLLASQRLDEGRLRGLEAHLSYRIGLRTFSAAESRSVLGVPDAVDLPPLPGGGYLRTGPGEPVRFRAAYASGPARATDARPVVGPYPPTTRATATAARAGSTVLEEVVAGLAGTGPRAKAIWLPPLDEPPTFGDLLGPVRADPRLGLVASRGRAAPLRLPLGILDRPRDHRRDPLVVDLAGAGGHVAVVGAPRSGRTTVLQTLVTGIALTHTPAEARVVLLDLAGSGLAPLATLPHVAAHATRAEPDVVRRVVGRVGEVLDRRASGADTGTSRLFVVVDGWGDLRADHDDLEPGLHRIAARGLAFGVHLVLTAGRWGDVRAATRDLVGSRIELRLGDPLDSEVDRRLARAVPADRPGRGLAADGHHLLTALPLVDDHPLVDLVARIAAAWPGAPAPRLGRLPAEVLLSTLRERAVGASGLFLGADDRGAVTLDLAAEPRLLVLGDRGSGRTTVLRTLLAEVVRTRTPEQAQVVVLDPRRGLCEAVPPGHLLAHHTTGDTAEPPVRELAEHLRGRLDRPGSTGAEVYVVVDDHELLEPSPLGPLLPLLPRAAEVGLRLLVARRTAGAARALHQPDLRALHDVGTPTLLLPGRPSEGPVVGRLAPTPGPPGRARLVDDVTGGVTELQVAR